jgi:hypothetical protein
LAQPTPYNRLFSFTSYQAANPTSPLPATDVDGELNLVKTTLDQILANLALIQRDDGTLAAGSVGFNQLDSGISLGISPATVWATTTSYVLNNFVSINLKIYRCLVPHISGTFATDLASGDWVLVADFTPAANTIPNSTLAQMPQLTIKGNNTGSTANALDLTVTQVQTMLAGTSGQAFPYMNGTNTWSGPQTFSALVTYGNNIKMPNAGAIYPATDSTTALYVTKADGATAVLTLDTTNARLGINKTPGSFDLDVNGAANVGGRLTFGTATITGLTNKASPDTVNDYVIIYDNSGTAVKKATVGSIGAAGSVASVNAQTGAVIIRVRPGGRLNVGGGGVPVVTSTSSGQTTVYYTPYINDQIPIYDGTNWVPTTFTELSQATTDATKSPAAATTNKNYDMFVWNDSGTVRCTRGPAWSSDTARGTGAGTTELQQVNGVWTNKQSFTNGPGVNRGTYVGTIRTNGSSQVDWIYGTAGSGAPGVAGSFGVWNMYNRVGVCSTTQDGTASWTYTSAAWRAADNSTTTRTSYVCGLAEDYFSSLYEMWTLLSSGTAFVGIGYDSTTSVSGIGGGIQTTVAVSINAIFKTTSLGFHYMQAIEYCYTGSVTYFSTFSPLQSGLTWEGRM